MKTIKFVLSSACVLSILLAVASRDPGKNMPSNPPATKKPCKDYATTETISFGNVSLKYSWSYIKQKLIDYNDLYFYHGLDDRNEVKFLSDIICPMSDNLEEDHRAYIKGTITNTGDCTGSKQTYTINTSNRVVGNTLYNATYMNKYFSSVKIEVSTIKGWAGGSLLWTATLTSQQMADLSVKNCQILPAYNIIKVSPGERYYRRVDITTLQPIDNTIPRTDFVDEPLSIDEPRCKEVEIIQPSLNKPVYVGSQKQMEKIWDNKAVLIEDTIR